MAKEIIIKREFLPKQWDFLKSEKKLLLYSGAFGAGKSVTLCAGALNAAQIPGNRVGIGRKTRKDLRQSTEVTLLKGEGKLGPILPKGSYHYHRTNNEITIYGGGTIILFGIDSPETLGSWPFGSIFMDQAEQLTEADANMLLGRCRGPADPKRQLAFACNPAHPTHWLAQWFGISGNDPKPNSEVIQTCSADNIHLPADYLEQLESLTGTDYDRYVLGKWVGYEGLVYDEWNPEFHIAATPENIKFEQVVAGIDEGFTHPAVRLSIGVYHIGDEVALHVFDEFYETGVQPTAFLDMCAGRSGRERTSLRVVDPSAAGLIADLNAKGLAAVAGENPIMDGIRAVKTFLRVGAHGWRRLTIDPRCKSLISEMTAYTWKPEKDMPVDKDNHALDALRYVCARFGKQYLSPRISILGEPGSETKKDVTGLSRNDFMGLQNFVVVDDRYPCYEEEAVQSVTADGDFGWTEW